MKVSEAISKARKLIDDTDETDWTDADLLVWYNDGVVHIRSLRPDTRIDTDTTEITYAAATTPATDDMIFAEPEKWVIAIAEYIASKAFDEDRGDKRDAARAAMHWEAYSRYIATL